MKHPANDTDKASLKVAARRMRITVLARTFSSDVLRAAADEAFARELEASLIGDLPCDEVIK